MEYTEISPLSFVSHLCLLFTFEYYYSKHVISTMSLQSPLRERICRRRRHTVIFHDADARCDEKKRREKQEQFVFLDFTICDQCRTASSQASSCS